MTSQMTLSSMSPIRNPQRPPSPPLPDTFRIDISTQNFQGIFLMLKKTSFMMSGTTMSSMSLVMLIILSMIVPEAQNRKKLKCFLPSSLSTLSIIGIVILIINIYISVCLSVMLILLLMIVPQAQSSTALRRS